MERVKAVLGIIFAYPFYGLGWLAGFTSKVARLTWAAVGEGFNTGKQL